MPGYQGKQTVTFDIPHMIATALIVLAVSWIVQHTAAIQGMSRGGRILVTFVLIFIPILILNLVWPYGSDA